MTTTTEAPKADSKTNTDDKPAKSKTKVKASKPKNTPSEDAIKAAMDTLTAAGMMDGEDQMEEVVAYKLRGLYSKVIDIIGKLTDDEGNIEAPTDEAPGIVIFPDGGFGYCEDVDDEDDEDDDIPTGKRSKGKRSKGKGKSKNTDDGDWRDEAQRLQKALIKYSDDGDVQAQSIRDKLGDKDGKNPSLTTVYNWLNGKSLPNRKYHRKLRKLLGV